MKSLCAFFKYFKLILSLKYRINSKLNQYKPNYTTVYMCRSHRHNITQTHQHIPSDYSNAENLFVIKYLYLIIMSPIALYRDRIKILPNPCNLFLLNPFVTDNYNIFMVIFIVYMLMYQIFHSHMY